VLLAAASTPTGTLFAADPPPAGTVTLSPAEALVRLREGNARYVAGISKNRDYSVGRAARALDQRPFAAIISCADSRVAPELIFDQGPGDLFVIRVAGNFVNEDILGSLEFAHKAAGAKLIVVMGHTSCGAIKGAADNVKLGNLTAVLAKIQPAVAVVKDDGTPRTSKNMAFVEKVSAANVRLAVQQIRERSPVLKEMLDAGQIGLVGAMYDLTTGRVTFYPDTAVNVKVSAL